MSGKIKEDLSDKRYGMLQVIKYDGNGCWTVKCDCGNVKHMRTRNFKYGQNKGCGCLRGKLKTIHGMSSTRLYQIWEAMKSRCQNPNSKWYSNYGGRGIKICQQWQSFEGFMKWAIESGYEDDLTIDRIDSDGNYEPLNCRWSNKKQQANNTRRNKNIAYNGEIRTMAEWAQYLGISYDTLRWRIRNWPVEKALTEPVHKERSRGRK